MGFLGEGTLLGEGERRGLQGLGNFGEFPLVFEDFFLAESAENFGSRVDAMFDKPTFNCFNVGFELGCR